MKTTQKNCENCGKQFEAKRADAKFCCPNCKQNAYVEREKLRKEQVDADKLQVKAENSAKLKELQAELEELEKVKEAEQQLAYEEGYRRMNESLKKYESDAIKERIEKANKILKGWLQQLIEFDKEDGTSVHKIKSLFEAIIRSDSYTFYDLPSDYKYFPFINNSLIPKVKNWYNEVRYSRERCIDLGLPKDAKKEFTNKIYELG